MKIVLSILTVLGIFTLSGAEQLLVLESSLKKFETSEDSYLSDFERRLKETENRLDKNLEGFINDSFPISGMTLEYAQNVFLWLREAVSTGEELLQEFRTSDFKKHNIDHATSIRLMSRINTLIEKYNSLNRQVTKRIESLKAPPLQELSPEAQKTLTSLKNKIDSAIQSTIKDLNEKLNLQIGTKGEKPIFDDIVESFSETIINLKGPARSSWEAEEENTELTKFKEDASVLLQEKIDLLKSLQEEAGVELSKHTIRKLSENGKNAITTFKSSCETLENVITALQNVMSQTK